MNTRSNYRGTIKDRKYERKSMTYFRPASTNTSQDYNSYASTSMFTYALNKHFTYFHQLATEMPCLFAPCPFHGPLACYTFFFFLQSKIWHWPNLISMKRSSRSWERNLLWSTARFDLRPPLRDTRYLWTILRETDVLQQHRVQYGV
jgi:hypothetical protein